MRHVHWTDKSVYRIERIVFRQHGTYESFDIVEALGRDLRNAVVSLDIHTGPIKAPNGVAFWLFDRAEKDNIDEHTLLELLKIYIQVEIPGLPVARYDIGETV